MKIYSYVKNTDFKNATIDECAYDVEYTLHTILQNFYKIYDIPESPLWVGTPEDEPDTDNHICVVLLVMLEEYSFSNAQLDKFYNTINKMVLEDVKSLQRDYPQFDIEVNFSDDTDYTWQVDIYAR